MLHNVVFLLGSNIDPRENYIQQATKLLIEEVGTLLSTSSIYETQPWGEQNQNYFLNQALIIKTKLDPENILNITQNIEKKLDRIKNIHWGPRTIDIDIIYYDNIIINLINLNIPHLKVQERKFVLIPLVEILPNYIHPIINKNQQQLLINCQDQQEVKVWKK